MLSKISRNFCGKQFLCQNLNYSSNAAFRAGSVQDSCGRKLLLILGKNLQKSSQSTCPAILLILSSRRSSQQSSSPNLFRLSSFKQKSKLGSTRGLVLVRIVDSPNKYWFGQFLLTCSLPFFTNVFAHFLPKNFFF